MKIVTAAEQAADIRRSRAARIQRNFRWKFLAGLIMAVVLPALIRSFFNPDPSLWLATLGTAVALVFGYYFFRSFSNFPGVRGGSYILPAFATSYGLVLAAFFFSRTEYSRLQFGISFVIAIVWYYVDYFVLRRERRLPTIGIVPVGAAEDLGGIIGARWKILSLDGTESMGCDSIAADLRAPMPDAWERFLADYAIAGVPVFHFKQLQESLTGTVQIEHLAENSFGALAPERVYLRVKALIDWLVALVALPFIVPIMLPVAISIKVESRGPILFKQRRVGFRGHPFTVYKFRTMWHVEEGDRTRADAITRLRDNRITRVGAVLRKYRIDELPQVINILLGQMSWIGPRPEAIILSQWYEAEIPFYRYRHIVRPGISGWAQVNQGHVADVVDVRSKLHFDFYYIKYFSAWLDLLIALRTARTILTGFGHR